MTACWLAFGLLFQVGAGPSAGSAAAGETSPGLEPRAPQLGVMVQVDVAQAPVHDFVAALGRRAGVRLGVAPDLAERLVAHSGPARPARAVLGDVAALLRAEWRAEGGGGRERWVLYPRAEAAAAESLERAALLARLADRFLALAAVAAAPAAERARRNQEPGGRDIVTYFQDEGNRVGARLLGSLGAARIRLLLRQGELRLSPAELTPAQRDLRAGYARLSIRAEEEDAAYAPAGRRGAASVSLFSTWDRAPVHFFVKNGSGLEVRVRLSPGFGRGTVGAGRIADPLGRGADPGPRGDGPVLAEVYRAGGEFSAPGGGSASGAGELRAELRALSGQPGWSTSRRGRTVLLRHVDGPGRRRYAVPGAWLTAFQTDLRRHDGIPAATHLAALAELSSEQLLGLQQMSVRAGGSLEFFFTAPERWEARRLRTLLALLRETPIGKRQLRRRIGAQPGVEVVLPYAALSPAGQRRVKALAALEYPSPAPALIPAFSASISLVGVPPSSVRSGWGLGPSPQPLGPTTYPGIPGLAPLRSGSQAPPARVGPRRRQLELSADWSFGRRARSEAVRLRILP